MRELSQEETVALMAERKANAMQRLREEQPRLDMLDKAGRVPGVVKRKIVGNGEPGSTLAKIITKAAGLEGFPIRSVEIRIACGEAIAIKAELFGTAENIAAAIAANEEV